MPGGYSTTGSNEVVANYIFQRLQDAAGQFGIDQTKGVYYGDQSRLPTTPAMCIIPGPEMSTYNGVGGRPVMKLFTTFVMVYFGLIRDIQSNTHASLALADQIEKFVHLDITLGGNVIDCMCAAKDPGVAARAGGALYDTSRLTFRSRSKVLLNP